MTSMSWLATIQATPGCQQESESHHGGDRRDAAEPPDFQPPHRRGQEKRQEHGDCERDQNIAGQVKSGYREKKTARGGNRDVV